MILLTGITGNNGGAAANALLEKGIKFRALVRDLDKASTWADKGVELVQGDLNDPASVTAALEGIDCAVLVLSNGQDQERLEVSFIETAKNAGLPWILKLSSPEAVRGTISPSPLAHIAAEDAIKESGMNWTFVRPSFFMQNFRGAVPQAKATGTMAMPMGTGTAVLTDCADAGAFIAHILTDENSDQHYGQCYDITGPDGVMTFEEIANVIGEVIGKEVKYVDADPKAYQEKLRPFVSSDWHSNAVAHLFSEIADGTTPGAETNTFKEIMGHQGTSFRDFLKTIV
ncbi:MAG: NmrA family NAD(P)-binding protein [Gammaproteobacteria bacterium]|nr:NmrA family NAD(P)-binding protein [Gammaproteobacteria bacterium]MCP4088307.1 NmrA family NAD(P)-binding protein [Gammaproteobacteria bacterium]MCP4276382.1 NmrA family NAD(P)-binding protein [Gammaproteobacteria bacterium]MCP4831029.1 NmrA family NAD(P)-binding protein [Gammaproteobacteria bacterium]MCP4927450.1 NmrA family NAD(P)-binding protein [Gammaproteobacteria bacterium]